MRDEDKLEEAYRMSARANIRIDEHEKLCSERYKQIHDLLEKMDTGIGKVSNRIWWVVTTGALIAAGVIVRLLVPVLSQGGT